jgi:hypothetical protein
MPEANSNGMILAKDEENDAEVRREDQDKINEFGQLNARLHEVRGETSKLKVSDGVSLLLESYLSLIFSLTMLLLYDHIAFRSIIDRVSLKK